MSQYKRVLANRVLHLYDVERIGQSRRKPLLAPVLNLFHDLKKYRDTEGVAARVAACIGLLITGGDSKAQQASNKSVFK